MGTARQSEGQVEFSAVNPQESEKVSVSIEVSAYKNNNIPIRKKFKKYKLRGIENIVHK